MSLDKATEAAAQLHEEVAYGHLSDAAEASERGDAVAREAALNEINKHAAAIYDLTHDNALDNADG